MLSDFTRARLHFSSGLIITLVWAKVLVSAENKPRPELLSHLSNLKSFFLFFPHIALSRSREPLALKKKTKKQKSTGLLFFWRSVGQECQHTYKRTAVLSCFFFFDSEELVIWRGEHIQYALQRIFKDAQAWSSTMAAG